MNGYTIQIYESAKLRAESLHLTVKISGDEFVITRQDGTMLGKIPTVDELASYVFGYEAGFSAGRYLCIGE